MLACMNRTKVNQVKSVVARLPHAAIFCAALTALTLTSPLPSSAAGMTGAARESYVKWSSETCLKDKDTIRSLLRGAGRKSGKISVERFCSCTPGEEANRLNEKRTAEEFFSAVRAAIVVCTEKASHLR